MLKVLFHMHELIFISANRRWETKDKTERNWVIQWKGYYENRIWTIKKEIRAWKGNIQGTIKIYW